MDGSGNLGPFVNNSADSQVQGSENIDSNTMAPVHNNSVDQLDNFGNIQVPDVGYGYGYLEPGDFDNFEQFLGYDFDFTQCLGDDEQPVDPALQYPDYPYDPSQPDLHSLEQRQQQHSKSPLSGFFESASPQQPAEADPGLSAVPLQAPVQAPTQARLYQPVQYQQPVQAQHKLSALPPPPPVQPYQFVPPQGPSQDLPAASNQADDFPFLNPGLYDNAFNPDPYQPQYTYPEAGIEGNHGVLGPYMDPSDVNQMPIPGPCRHCGGYNWAHYYTCPVPRQGFPGHALPQLEQPLQQQPQQQRPKRSWKDEDDDEIDYEDGEPPAKTAKTAKTISRRTTRASKGKTTTKNAGKKVYPYCAWKQLDPWVTKSGFELEYLPAGQLEEHIFLSAENLRDYLEECPRQVKIWLQNSPSKCKGRQEDVDMKCRYAGCPTQYGTILHGWHRVAFDEFHEYTTDGTKDPFKMAGVMHLWCFEQCIDPYESIEKDQLQPDVRKLLHEETNRAAINRDDYKGVVQGAIKPWLNGRKKVGVTPVPYPLHEDTLSWRLCNYHVQHQTNARESCRKKRNALRPDDERKTIEIIMGDLSEYVARDKLSKMRIKRRHEQAKGLDVVTPPPTAQRQESSRVRREALREITSPVQRIAPPAEVSIQNPLENLHSQPDKAVRVHTTKSRVASRVEDTIFVHDDAGQDVSTPSSLFGSPSAGAPEPELPSPVVQNHKRKRNSGSSSPSARKRPRVQTTMPTSGAGRSPRASAPDSQPSPLRRSSRVIEKRTP